MYFCFLIFPSRVHLVREGKREILGGQDSRWVQRNKNNKIKKKNRKYSPFDLLSFIVVYKLSICSLSNLLVVFL